MSGHLTLPGRTPLEIPSLHEWLRGQGARPEPEATQARPRRASPAVRRRRRAVKAARKANR